MKIKPGLLNDYEGKYVAISRDGKKVVAFGRTIESVHKKLVKMKDKESTMLWVFRSDSYYTFQDFAT